jgi:hypothetical protein
MNAKSLARTLLTLFGERGVPSFVRHNDGPQSVAERLPERFNRSLRDAWPNTETFYSRDHTRARIRPYRRHYDPVSPARYVGLPDAGGVGGEKAGRVGRDFPGGSECRTKRSRETPEPRREHQGSWTGPLEETGDGVNKIERLRAGMVSL